MSALGQAFTTAHINTEVLSRQVAAQRLAALSADDDIRILERTLETAQQLLLEFVQACADSPHISVDIFDRATVFLTDQGIIEQGRDTLLQDNCRELSMALARDPQALAHVRDAAAGIKRGQL